ncbi:MAG TPA: sulfite exporter TauE/SafE family protein [Hyphomicrobiaceae bacterium]|nr:sulfite exporter TauE/SafE family protein [Hyphomicrobiaceae bacterium]
MELFYVGIALFGLFFAGIIKGASGLGYSSCALPFLAASVGLKSAIVLVVIPAVVSNIAVMWTAGHFKETVARFWPFYAASLPGIVVGIMLLGWIDQRIAEVVLGVLIVAYAVIAVTRPPFFLPERLQRPLQVPAGLLNGLFTGLTGSQVLPLLPYMLALRLDPDRMVQAVNIAVTLAAGFMAIGLLTAGMMTLPGLGFSIAATIPAMAGILIGTRLRRLILAAQFRIIVLIVLGVLGLILIIRS